MTDNTIRNQRAEIRPATALTAHRQTKLDLKAVWVAWSEPLTLFTAWRVGLTMLAFLAALLIPAYATHNGVAPQLPLMSPWAERLVGVWGNWDGEWFLHIAEVGYRPDEPTSPFFPLYPLLVRGVSLGLGHNYVLAGVIVSLLLSLAAFVLFYELVKFEFDTGLANEAVLYLAVFPTSFFLAACYSEGLFLTLTLGAFLVARRYRNWWLVGLLVGLACVTRNLGPTLLLPLGWEWLRQQWETYQAQPTPHRPIRQTLQNSSSLIWLIGLPMMLFGGWLWYQGRTLGNPLEFMAVQSNTVWQRQTAWPWQTVWQSVEMILKAKPSTGFTDDHNLLDLAFWLFEALLLGLALWQTWRKQLPLPYLLYFGVAFLVPLLSPSKTEPLMSTARFALVMFPAFIVLARLGQRWRLVRYGYVFLGLVLLALLFSRFTNWYWVA